MSAEVRMLYYRKSPDIKQAIFHGQTDDTLHIIQFRTVKAVHKLLVKFVTDRDIIPFPGIDVRQRFHQCGKGRINLHVS